MGFIEPKQKRLKNGAEIVIRAAEPSDAPELTAYAHEIFRTSPFLITQSDEFHNDVAKEEAWIRDMKSAPGSILLLAVQQGQIVGNIDLTSQPARRRIAHRGEMGMSVAERYWGQGIARLLLMELIEWAKSPNCPIEKIELGVFFENKSALELYKATGFEQEGLIRKAAKLGIGKFTDEIRMAYFVK